LSDRNYHGGTGDTGSTGSTGTRGAVGYTGKFLSVGTVRLEFWVYVSPFRCFFIVKMYVRKCLPKSLSDHLLSRCDLSFDPWPQNLNQFIFVPSVTNL